MDGFKRVSKRAPALDFRRQISPINTDQNLPIDWKPRVRGSYYLCLSVKSVDVSFLLRYLRLWRITTIRA